MHQGGAVEIDAVARQHLRLAMQRQMPGELRHRDMRQQRGRRQPAFDRTRRRRRLHHGALAGAAAVARAGWIRLTRMIAGTMSSDYVF